MISSSAGVGSLRSLRDGHWGGNSLLINTGEHSREREGRIISGKLLHGPLCLQQRLPDIATGKRGNLSGIPDGQLR